MTFLTYAPGLQPLTYDFSNGSETFDTFGKIAMSQGMPMHNLNYQNNKGMPSPGNGGITLAHNIETLQNKYGTSGVLVGNSVGGHMMLEAASWLTKPEHIILYGPVLGVQSKIVELAMMQGPQAIGFLDGVINGKGEFPVPVAGGGGAVPINRHFFDDEASIWVQAFNDERLAKMQEVGFSQPTLNLLKTSQDSVAAFRKNLEGVGITILVGEKDMYCHAGDIAAFQRDVAPHTEVIKMSGDHGWNAERPGYFSAAIAPFAPKRPDAQARHDALKLRAGSNHQEL